jgi:hypothetical protein
LSNNPKYALTSSLYVASLTFGFYFVRGAVNIASKYLASKYGKPSLIRLSYNILYFKEKHPEFLSKNSTECHIDRSKNFKIKIKISMIQ